MTEIQQQEGSILWEWLRFGIVGILATVTYLLVSLLTETLGVWPYAASLAGYLASVGISYFGHRQFTFRSKAPHRATGPKFLVVTLTVFALTNLLLFVLSDLLGRPFFVATLVIAVTIPFATWALSRFWVFGIRKR